MRAFGSQSQKATMTRPNRQEPAPRAKVVDFDEAMLDACPDAERHDLMTEADLLARAFTSEGRPGEIARLAEDVQSGVPHLHQGRAYARRLVAALRRLAHSRARP